MEKYNIRKVTLDDLGMTPKEYQTGKDPVVLTRDLNWMMFFVEGDDTPHYYFRKNAMDEFHWAGIVKPDKEKNLLSPQCSCHYKDMAQKGTIVEPYRKISDNPVVYELSSKEPFCSQKWYEDHAEFKEGDFLDFRADYWPICFFAHEESAWMCDYSYQPFTLSGTYEGKKIKGLGQFDRIFMPNGSFSTMDKKKTVSYGISSSYLGIRKDGRREIFYCMIHDDQEFNPAYYWLEGEEPIATEKVEYHTEFYRLPYNLPGDDTCTYSDTVFKFEGKEIHYKAEWGTRRFTDDPLHERIGYSNHFGTWYEGDGNYEYEVIQTFNESTTATVENLRKQGFIVHE